MGSNFIGRKDERIWLDEKEKDESDEPVRWLSDDMRMNQSEKKNEYRKLQVDLPSEMWKWQKIEKIESN